MPYDHGDAPERLLIPHWLRALVPSTVRHGIVQSVAGRQLEQRDNEVAALSTRFEKLERKLTAARQEAAQRSQEVAEVRQDAAQLRQEADELFKEAAELRQEAAERSQEVVQLRQALTSTEQAWASRLDQTTADLTHQAAASEAEVRSQLTRAHERQVRQAARRADKALNDSEHRRKFLEMRVRQSAALLRMNSTQAIDGAYEILRAAAVNSTADESGSLVLDGEADSRLSELRLLTQIEANCGRWTSLYRTEVRAGRTVRDSQPSSGFLLLNDTRTQNNIGCRATTDGLMVALAEHGISIDHTITLGEIHEMANQLRERAGQPPNPENFDLYVDLLYSSEAFTAVRQIAQHSAGVVINAEGSIYDEQPKGLVLLVLAHVLSERLDKRVAIMNFSADLSSPVMEEWARRTLPSLAWCAFRDPLSSVKLPADFPPLPGPGWVPDAAFLVDPALERVPSVQPEISLGSDAILTVPIPEKYVVLSGSSSLYRRDRTRSDVQDAFTSLCTRLRERGLNPLLWEADKQDRALLRTVAIDLELPYMSASVPFRAAQEVLTGAACMLSGRWHASILAARWGCTPILGDANFFKTEALHQMLDLDAPMFNYRDLDKSLEPMVDAMAEIAANQNDHRVAVAQRADELASDVRSGLAGAVGSLLGTS
jgi:hypothetical protein